MNDGGLSAIFLQNLPVLVVVLPLLLAVVAAVIPAPRAAWGISCLLYTSPSPRDKRQSRMPSSA